MPYEPISNDDALDFDPAKIEQMKVEFDICPRCNGEGMVFNGICCYNCPKCFGTGESEKEARK